MTAVVVTAIIRREEDTLKVILICISSLSSLLVRRTFRKMFYSLWVQLNYLWKALPTLAKTNLNHWIVISSLSGRLDQSVKKASLTQKHVRLFYLKMLSSVWKINYISNKFTCKNPPHLWWSSGNRKPQDSFPPPREKEKDRDWDN